MIFQAQDIPPPESASESDSMFHWRIILPKTNFLLLKNGAWETLFLYKRPILQRFKKQAKGLVWNPQLKTAIILVINRYLGSNGKVGYPWESTRHIYQHIPPIYGLYDGCIGQYNIDQYRVLFGEELLGEPSQTYTQHYRLMGRGPHTQDISHTVHVTGIFTNIWLIFVW